MQTCVFDSHIGDFTSASLKLNVAVEKNRECTLKSSLELSPIFLEH